ncbi:Predicted methyltransferase [Pseudoxanthomonas sp. GM95]|uniref:class I SAM-dependent methyltransferase n=1 Tax=Pseudoxanthomonas sp. GM95 TaxID=1881043 RepID=UPI0008B87D58|nr:class I SAM-dependent methyltransferase [Pseudoxanthomonas sp. GM95]SEM25585.1 Predicted methyltransferase [Pseudoxanthomonas sp. GM95]
MRRCLVTLALCAALVPMAPAFAQQSTTAITVPAPLQSAIDGAWRKPADVARDKYRHPGQTLTFFGVQPHDTVIEITPGSGWYSAILAPYLKTEGQYIAAVVDPAAVAEKSRAYQQKSKDSLEAFYKSDAAHYGKAKIISYAPATPSFGPANSADVVLTFRNVHNWRMADNAEAMFKGFFAVLKSGGTLGVVEHRAKGEVADGDESGYVGETQVIALATAAGFKLEGKSEINANPRDTKDYPGGVWTLPPTNSHDKADDAKYQAIGESDRMTLRFVKP